MQSAPQPADHPFHDHRWHVVEAGPDADEVFLCDECGVTWSL